MEKTIFLLKTYLFSLIYIGLCLLNGSVFGQDRVNLEKQKNENIEKLKYTQTLLEQTRTKKTSSLNQIDILNKSLSYRQSLIATLKEQENYLDNEISRLEESINLNKTEISRLKDEYSRMIKLSYRMIEKDYALMYILGSEDMNQAYQRLRYIRYANDYRRKTIFTMLALNDSLLADTDELKGILEEKQVLIRNTESEKIRLEKDRQQKSKSVQELQKREKELLAELKRREDIQRKIEGEIRRLIEEEARKAREAKKPNTLTAEEKLVSDEFGKNLGRLPWPSDKGIVTTRFGKQNHPDLKGIIINSNGIDISTVSGTSVRAVFRGEVTKVIAILGANYTVIIKHGNYRTVYQNLIDVKVKAGDKVNTKQVLGTVYTDEANNSRFHFEIWKDLELLDPEKWLSR